MNYPYAIYTPFINLLKMHLKKGVKSYHYYRLVNFLCLPKTVTIFYNPNFSNGARNAFGLNHEASLRPLMHKSGPQLENPFTQ